MKKKGIAAPLSGDELRKIIRSLGLTQAEMAEMGGVSTRQGQRLVEGGMKSFDAVLMRLLAAHPELLPEAWEAAGLPDGRKAAPRGRPRKENT